MVLLSLLFNDLVDVESKNTGMKTNNSAIEYDTIADNWFCELTRMVSWYSEIPRVARYLHTFAGAPITHSYPLLTVLPVLKGWRGGRGLTRRCRGMLRDKAAQRP